MSNNSNNSGRGILALLLGVLLLVITLILYGPQAAITTVMALISGEELPDFSQFAEQAPVVETASGDFYTVYFTNPIDPFDEDLTTGGVDANLVPLLNQAQSTIDLAVFEFNLDTVAQALIDAHNRGVRVRVVYDDEHTEDDPQIEQLIQAGIPAVPDERSAFMHNKFIVIDGETVWTGSMNLTINGVYRNNNNVIVLRSPALAENYTTEFEEMFNGEFGPTSPENVPNPVVNIGDTRVETYFASEGDVIPSLVDVVSGAQQSIHIMIFSFTEDRLGEAVRERLNAGVEVAAIFETRGANTEFSECPPLLQAGADVRLDENPRTFHHKVIIVDGRTVVIGSFNFSVNATESNDENLLIIDDPEIAGLYEQEFNRQLANSYQATGSECLRSD